MVGDIQCAPPLPALASNFPHFFPLWIGGWEEGMVVRIRFLSGSSETTKKSVMTNDLMINLNISLNTTISPGDQNLINQQLSSDLLAFFS